MGAHVNSTVRLCGEEAGRRGIDVRSAGLALIIQTKFLKLEHT